MVDRRKDDLRRRRTGAIMHHEPGLLWVKMLPTPLANKAMAIAKTKFNVILEQAILQTTSGRISSSNEYDCGRINYNNFDRNGNITHEGRVTYWNVIDADIRSLDCKQIHGSNTRGAGDSGNDSNRNNNRRYILPRPQANLSAFNSYNRK